MKAFSKGDKATQIGSWDNKGTVFYRDVIVYSCGRKQMVLTDAITGEEIGRHFAPVIGSLDSINWCVTFPRMTEQQAVETCLIAGARIVELERVRMQDCIQRNSNDARYVASMQHDVDALHEPRAIRHP
jgi:hypothetical protein